MKNPRPLLTLIITLTLGVGIACGQTPQKHPSGTAGGLHPVFSTTLGNVVSHQKLPASLMKTLLDSTLVARDSAGHPYPVVNFTFGYATTSTYVNDTTGRPASSRTYLSFHFKGNRLDSIWRKGIREKLRSGDVLYFDRIIAAGPGHRHYLSAPLQYTVE